MKKNLLAALTVATILSCNNPKEYLTGELKKQVMQIATEFAEEKLDSATVITDNKGVVSVSDSLVRYLIDPAGIFTGNISENAEMNMLVSIDSLHDPFLVPAWHLIIDAKDDQLQIIHIIRSDMKVLGVKNGIITADIPTHLPSSPLYYCDECRDTVQYQIRKGELILLLDPVLN